MRADYNDQDFCVISAINDEGILKKNLAVSPDIVSGRLPLTTVKGAPSMSRAYNEGLARTTADICVLVHQDVYLPAGWLDRAIDVINILSAKSPRWMVAGPYGVREDGEHIGRVWDANMKRELGDAQFPPTPVGSLDELLLILRRHDRVLFDERLPDFHLFGTDLVQTARQMGCDAFAVEMPVVHNNRPWHSLSGGYVSAYRYARRKWHSNLPIYTTVCALSRNPLPLLRARWRRRRVKARDDYPLGDARELARIAGYEGS